MTVSLHAVCVSARAPERLVEFWSGMLGWAPGPGAELVPDDDTRFVLRFTPSPEPKAGQNLMHFDLQSWSLDDQREKVARALALGGRHVDVGQRGDEGHVVLGDPEGNEFCVIEPGNRFLADCGYLGALSCDGSRAVGHFWSRALGWPLVWDQGEETAIRSPHGGPKITWGGPPLLPRTTAGRFRYELEPTDVDRLVALGATVIREQTDRTVLTDPDGNEFEVLLTTR